MSRFEGKICPVCRKRFEENDETVVCPVCGTPHHRECYLAQNKCVLEDKHGSFVWEGELPEEFAPVEAARSTEAAQSEGNTQSEKTAHSSEAAQSEETARSTEAAQPEESAQSEEREHSPESAQSADGTPHSMVDEEELQKIRSNPDKKEAVKAFSEYIARLEERANELRENDCDTPAEKLDKQVKREIEGMMGMLIPSGNAEIDSYHEGIRDNLANTYEGLDGVSMRELTFFTATSIWHFSKTFAPFAAHRQKASFNLPCGLFAPVYQFFRKMDGLGFALLALIAVVEGVPPLLHKLDVISQTLTDNLLIGGSFVLMAAVVLLCIFGDYLYYRFSVKKILKIRSEFEGKTDTIDYYHALYNSGRPSMLKGLFGCLAMTFVQVFIQVFLIQ